MPRETLIVNVRLFVLSSDCNAIIIYPSETTFVVETDKGKSIMK